MPRSTPTSSPSTRSPSPFAFSFSLSFPPFPPHTLTLTTLRQTFLECFAELGDTATRREEYFRLYSQLYYVVQRNTKEEVVQELLPKVRFPPPPAPAPAVPQSQPQPQPPPQAPPSPVQTPQRVYIAEKGGVYGSNEAVLREMQLALAALTADTAALREQLAAADADAAQLAAAVQEAQEALVDAFLARQQPSPSSPSSS